MAALSPRLIRSGSKQNWHPFPRLRHGLALRLAKRRHARPRRAPDGKEVLFVSDYLGTPLQAYDKNGEKVWEQELDSFGRKRRKDNNNSSFIPFKYQGQYEDAETGLYYNRFRYYDPNAGSYISQDPIGLAGDNPTLYAYVSDVNYWNDVLGLTAEVYKLVATKDGYYDVYEWGNDKPMGKTHLKKGDTWKIGETTNFRTKKDGTEIQNRYTKKWLRQEQFRI